MQWVETTGRTVEEAKSRALDQLGVDTDEAEFEILAEPRPGLFGRIRGEARVRARVRPTRPRPKLERRDRKRRPAKVEATPESQLEDHDGSSPDDDRGRSSSERATRQRQGAQAPRRQRPDHAMSTSTREDTTMATEHETPGVDPATVGAAATTFLEGLLEAFGLAGTVSSAQDGSEIEVRVEGSDLGLLVGPRGSTLVAVQDLTRVVAQRRLGDHETRLRVDVAGYRERRRAALERFATTMADEVAASGVARVLEPMVSADRKVIHDVLAGRSDVTTRSEGEEPHRRIIIDPAE